MLINTYSIYIKIISILKAILNFASFFLHITYHQLIKALKENYNIALIHNYYYKIKLLIREYLAEVRLIIKFRINII